MVCDLFLFFRGEIEVKVFELFFFDRFVALDEFWDVVEDRSIEFKIVFLNTFDRFFHLILDFSDLFVPLVDGEGADFFWKWEILDAFFNIFESDFAWFLNKGKITKKSNINNEFIFIIKRDAANINVIIHIFMKLEDQRITAQKNDNSLDPEFLTFRDHTPTIEISPRVINSQRMEYKSL